MEARLIARKGLDERRRQAQGMTDIDITVAGEAAKLSLLGQ